MYLLVEENPNCPGEERRLTESGAIKIVTHLRLDGPTGSPTWWAVTGVDENEIYRPAEAVQIEDSGAGNAWLIFGGLWGLRFRPEESKAEWSFQEKSQWGEAFKVLDISGEDIRFQ